MTKVLLACIRACVATIPARLTPPPPPLWAAQIDGDWRYDMRKSCLVWSIELIDNTNRTGSAEFVVPAAPADTFFPIEASWLTG